MEGSVKLGSIRGIPLGINYTWLIIFGLVTGSLALGYFPQVTPGLSVINYWILGVLASVLLFGSVLLHELSHSFVAQAQGMKVKNITLFLFGGVSNIEGEPRSGRDEMLMAAAGPIASIIIGLVLFVIWSLFSNVSAQLTALLQYLFSVNFLLAAFNLIPGFPLDGGRVLRAIIWSATGDLQKATNIASSAGQVIGYVFIFAGLIYAFSGNVIGGIWLAFIGWFLNNAAEQSRRQMGTQTMLQGVKVSNVMNPQPIVVDTDVSVQRLVDDYVLRRNVRALAVERDGRLVGLVTLSDVRHVAPLQWAVTPVAGIMTSKDELKTVRPSDELSEALRQLAEHDLNQLPVVEGERLVGMLSRAEVIRFLQLRQELGISTGAVDKRLNTVPSKEGLT